MPDTHEPSDHVTPPAVTPPAPAYAPPHPYAAPAAQPGSGLGIAAMALGLVSLLTVGVGFFAVTPMGLFAALFGIVAIVLGIVALVCRQRAKAPAIAGIASGAIGVIASIVLAAYVLMVALSPGWTGGFDSAPTETHSHESDPESGESGGPQSFTPLDFTGEWPENYADGGITFGEDFAPVPSKALTPGDVPLLPRAERGEGPADILLFVDYRCPICMSFEQANAPTLESVIESGAATLQVRTLTFLDRASSGSAYSSRAAGALACIATEQPASSWLAHTTLLSANVQPPENTPGLDDKEIIAAIEQEAGALSPAARSCITDQTFVPFAQAFTNWSFENPVPNAVNSALMVEGTPLAVVNGVPYQGPVNDPAEFRAFLEAQGVTVP